MFWVDLSNGTDSYACMDLIVILTAKLRSGGSDHGTESYAMLGWIGSWYWKQTYILMVLIMVLRANLYLGAADYGGTESKAIPVWNWSMGTATKTTSDYSWSWHWKQSYICVELIILDDWNWNQSYTWVELIMVLRAKMVAQSRTVDSLSKAPCVSISKMAIWKTDHQQEHIMHLVFLSSVLATNHVYGGSGYYCSFT